MYILRSFIVLTLLCIAIIISVVILKSSFSQKHSENTSSKILAVLICTCTIFMVLLGCKYVNPFDRTIEFELVCVFETTTPHSTVAGQRFWHGAYEDGWINSGSEFYANKTFKNRYGDTWPELDLENYSYIITYGQELLSLSYNVWDTIRVPIYMGAYMGDVKLSEEFDSYKIYIYRIPKLRIDNYP